MNICVGCYKEYHPEHEIDIYCESCFSYIVGSSTVEMKLRSRIQIGREAKYNRSGKVISVDHGTIFGNPFSPTDKNNEVHRIDAINAFEGGLIAILDTTEIKPKNLVEKSWVLFKTLDAAFSKVHDINNIRYDRTTLVIRLWTIKTKFKELKSVDSLACSCAIDEPCHADVYLELLKG